MFKLLPITSLFKYLEIDKPPSGNQSKQVHTLINYVLRELEYSVVENSTNFSLNFILKTHLRQKLMCPLVYSHHSLAQYHFIQKKYINWVISSINYNHTWPIEFRFGDNPYCGLQLKHLEIELLIKKIYSVRQLLFKPDTSQFFLLF